MSDCDEGFEDEVPRVPLGNFSRYSVFPEDRRIDFDYYEAKVMSFAIYPERGTGKPLALSYTALGLNGEAGEAAEQVKKALRDDGGVLASERAEALKRELGDVLWYITALAREAGFSLRQVAEANVEKLFDRAKRGTLGGSGDNR